MITTTTPILSLHYTPGILVVLKREPCQGQQGIWGIQHSTCHCWKEDRHVYKTAGLHLLQGDEQSWCLERSWVKK